MSTTDLFRDHLINWARYRVLGEARAAACRGDRVSCPCCGGTYSRFRPHRNRADVKCPRCGSLERHRLLWVYLHQRTNLFSAPLDVLHVAPEYCFTKRLSGLHGTRYVTADRDSPLADVQLDVTAMPFGEDSFDVVLCNHVLEHVDDDLVAMREIMRVLRPGGWAILLVPIDQSLETTFEDRSIISSEERLRRYGQEDHARLYGRDYAGRLRSAGFHVDHEDFGATLPEELAERHRLLRDGAFEEIYRCEKPRP